MPSLFPSHVQCLKFTSRNVIVLKDSEMDSENLGSMIRLSVSDGQKTDDSKDVLL